METTLYQMNVGDVAVHVREVVRTLKSHGISASVAAEKIGVKMRTLKAYLSSGGNHRGIQARHLDKLRDLAVSGYWSSVRGTPEVEGYWTVWLCQRGVYEKDAFFRGRVFDDHTHHMRAIEIADTRVGEARLYSGSNPFGQNPFDTRPPALEGDALLRHRLRVVRYTIECSMERDGMDPEWTVMQLCDAIGVSRYVLWRLHTEYAPWRLPVTEEMVVTAETFLHANFMPREEVAA